jgi:O-antigen ligase
MRALLQRNKDYFAYLGLMMIVLGLPLSRAMMSIGMIVLVVLAFFQSNYNEKFLKFIKTPPFIAIAGFYFLVLASGLWSDDKIFFLERIRIKLPFLLLPLALFVIAPIKKEGFLLLLKAYFWVMVLCIIWSVSHLLAGLDSILNLYAMGKVLPTPVNHIRFSLMAVMAVITAYYIWKKGLANSSTEKTLMLVFSVFIVLYIHILSVRSGILALYVAAIILALKYVVETKKYKLLLAILITVTLLPVLAYNFSPTFKMKYYYMAYEMRQYKAGDYTIIGSDIRRLLSIQSGVEATSNNVLFGVGYGDIQQETYKVYAHKFPTAPEESKMLPHNQFVFIYTGLGIVGLVVFLLSFFVPLFYQRAYTDDMVLGISIVMFTSFLSEYTLENQLGVAIYLFFLLLPLCQHLNNTAVKMKQA